MAKKSQLFTAAPFVERLAQAKALGTTAQALHKELLNEGQVISLGYLKQLLADLPRRPARSKTAFRHLVSDAMVGSLNGAKTAPPNPSDTQPPKAATPAPLAHKFTAKLNEVEAAQPRVAASKPAAPICDLEMTVDQALIEIEKVVQAQYSSEWSLKTCREAGDIDAIEMLEFCASLRASMSPTSLEQKDEFGNQGLKTLNTFYPATPNAKGVGTILRAWLRDEALRFPRFI